MVVVVVVVGGREGEALQVLWAGQTAGLAAAGGDVRAPHHRHQTLGSRGFESADRLRQSAPLFEVASAFYVSLPLLLAWSRADPLCAA